MKKVVVLALLLAVFWSCGSNDRGELVGVKAKRKWFSEKPHGMVLIPGGSFTMGKQDQDIIGTMSAPTKTVTVRPYFMDETEITNNEYKEFVHWVRDSIVRTKLAFQAENASLMNSNPNASPDERELTGGIYNYSFAITDTINASPYQKYMYENYYSLGERLDSIRPLSWKNDIIWKKEDYPDIDYVEVMDSLYIPKEDAIDGIRTFDTNYLKYKYSWFDANSAAKKGGNRKDFLKNEIVNVYPRYNGLGKRF